MIQRSKLTGTDWTRIFVILQEKIVNDYKNFNTPMCNDRLSLFTECYTHHTMISVCLTPQSQCCDL